MTAALFSTPRPLLPLTIWVAANEPHQPERPMNAKVQTTVLILVLLCCSAIASWAMAQDKGLALMPPMGWNSWNHIAERNDSRTVRAQADGMVASGMKDAGCVYIITRK
jgi:alpha-galactosidase